MQACIYLPILTRSANQPSPNNIVLLINWFSGGNMCHHGSGYVWNGDHTAVWKCSCFCFASPTAALYLVYSASQCEQRSIFWDAIHFASWYTSSREFVTRFIWQGNGGDQGVCHQTCCVSLLSKWLYHISWWHRRSDQVLKMWCWPLPSGQNSS